MSSNKRIPIGSATPLAALVASLGAVLGVTSAQVQAADPAAPGTGTPRATAGYWKINPKVNPPPVVHRGLAPAAAAPAQASSSPSSSSSTHPKKAKKRTKPAPAKG